jgi:hypothetical protein
VEEALEPADQLVEGGKAAGVPNGVVHPRLAESARMQQRWGASGCAG